MAWAVESIEPNKRRKTVKHLDVLRSDLVKADALARYQKTRDVYRLACSLCAICVKNAARLSEQAICGIIEEIDAYLARCPDQRCPTPVALDDPRCQALTAAVMCVVKTAPPPAALTVAVHRVNAELSDPLPADVVDRIISQARPLQACADA